MSEKLLIDAEIAPAHVADEAVGFESAFMDGYQWNDTSRAFDGSHKKHAYQKMANELKMLHYIWNCRQRSKVISGRLIITRRLSIG